MRLKLSESAFATVETSSVFASPGHADEQAVPAAEEGHEELFDHRFLPEDDLADLFRQPLVGGGQFADGRRIGNRGNGRIGRHEVASTGNSTIAIAKSNDMAR